MDSPVRTAPQPTSPDARALTGVCCSRTVEHDVDSFLTTHGKNHGSYQTYSGLLSLCISDVAKPLLLHNPAFIPHLVRGTLLTHVPRCVSRCVLRSVDRVRGCLAGCSDGLPRRYRSSHVCCLGSSGYNHRRCRQGDCAAHDYNEATGYCRVHPVSVPVQPRLPAAPLLLQNSPSLGQNCGPKRTGNSRSSQQRVKH